MGRSALPKRMLETLGDRAAAGTMAARVAGLAKSRAGDIAGTSGRQRSSQTLANKRALPTALPGAVRIIGGQWRRRKLPVAQGQAVPAGLRPTADRVRETLFNWLGQDLSGWVCVDMCAGTGALGFEAASRGAARVSMIEQHPAVLPHLHAACQQLGARNVHIEAGDGARFLRQQAEQAPGSVDVIFFDPPYGAFSDQARADVLAVAAMLLAPDGRFYLEAGREWPAQELADLGWERMRYLKAGAVHAHLLRFGTDSMREREQGAQA